MKKTLFFILFLLNPLNACEYFFNLKKAGIIVETNARQLVAGNINNKFILAAESALNIYYFEYNKSCRICQQWSDNNNYVFVEILEKYLKENELKG
jgi:hypothetical protein